ncbi:universal stress protein [Carnimonas bestiolae]|uniref:universal stress protein n=1 Tax=Carnimonas bestiolae TaxID=3402172 RepID=UPI003EDC0BFF
MAQLHTILLATDFSQGSVKAAAMTLTLSSLSGASVHVVNVALPLSHSSGVESTLFAHSVDADTINGEIVDDAIRRLNEFTDTHLRSSNDVQPGKIETRVIQASLPDEAIIEEAQRIKADLIIMGTHGRRGLRRVLLGSTAERVVRASPIPVLSTRDPEDLP